MRSAGRTTLTLFAILFLVGASCLASSNFLRVDAGLLFIGNADPDSAPSPLVQTIGISVPVQEGQAWVLYTGIQVFGTLNQLAEGRPLPVEIEVPGQRWLWVLGGIADLRAGLKMGLGSKVDLAVLVGPALVLRYPVLASAEAEADKSAAIKYYYDKGRFFYPEAEIFVRVSVSERLAVGMALRGLVPAYHLWSDQGMPFWDEAHVLGVVGFHVRLW